MPMRIIASCLLAAVMVIAPATAANAVCYSDQTIEVTGGTVVGGKPITLSANHPGGFEGDWTLTLEETGETATAEGTSSISHKYKTKKTATTIHTKVTATFTFDDEQCEAAGASGAVVATQAGYSADTAASLAAAPQTITAAADVTILPKGGLKGDGGDLPNTGGMRLLLLLAGLLAVVGGGYGAYRLRNQ